MSARSFPRARGAVIPALLAAALGGVAAGAGAQEPPTSQACATCHLELTEERLVAPALLFPGDVHAHAGFGCLDCHGSGAGAAQPAPVGAPGFISRPERRDIPALCGRCHADAAFMRGYDPALRVDQVTEYASSVHGTRLRELDDAGVATCVSCHPAHDIRPPSDPTSTVHPLNVAATCARCHADTALMGPRGVPTDQADEHRLSVHGRLLFEEGDVSAPTCNDCHGNHGAAPPGLASVRNVCGQCHATMADFFAASGHVEPFDVDERPGCATCHGNHGVRAAEDADLGERSEAVCSACHGSPGDPHGGEFEAIRGLLDSLIAARAGAQAVLLEAENRGMEVSQALFELEDANTALTKARAAIHSFRVEPVAGELEEGFERAAAAVGRGRAALEEHRFRRVGLALSSLVIMVLIAGLVMKIREIEGTQGAYSPTPPPPPGAGDD